MADVFSFEIEARPTGRAEFDVITASFGDGYTQAAANGINNKMQSWEVKATGSLSDEIGMDVGGIKDFLDEQQGWRAFEWAAPDGYVGLFRCSSYNLSHLSADLYTITATFADARQ